MAAILLFVTLAGASASDRPDLQLPAPQRCLAEPMFSHLVEDPADIAYEGLGAADVARAMDLLLPETRHCFPGGVLSNGAVEAWFQVSCSGQVEAVEVVQSRLLTDDVTACISDTLYYAAFPAHDTPGGVAFGYTLRFRAPSGGRP